MDLDNLTIPESLALCEISPGAPSYRIVSLVTEVGPSEPHRRIMPDSYVIRFPDGTSSYAVIKPAPAVPDPHFFRVGGRTPPYTITVYHRDTRKTLGIADAANEHGYLEVFGLFADRVTPELAAIINSCLRS